MQGIISEVVGWRTMDESSYIEADARRQRGEAEGGGGREMEASAWKQTHGNRHMEADSWKQTHGNRHTCLKLTYAECED